MAGAIRLLGRVLGRTERGESLANTFLGDLQKLAYSPPVRPRIYFEEWNNPMITCIPWISEIIQAAGGDDIFAERSSQKAEQRVVSPGEVVAANPQIILASWCGKALDIDSVRNRDGFSSIDAVRTARIYEMAPEMILQAGPGLVSGLEAMVRIVRNWKAGEEGKR